MKDRKLSNLILMVAMVILLTIVTADDFYEILNVPKSATAKEIRKAFKKLAMTKHPDKNTDDPKAHEKFLKINRAYEVLKDDDLRKKYDQYGEEGLKEDFHGGGRYESWKFYQEEFGLYDDDKEIITLSRADFEQSVEGTDDIWFVNFYSTGCSHCHDLAPTWREVARELEGVVRIGAVNCGDDWQLCRMQGIRSYPSLVMYPAREKYHDERKTKQLVKFALKQVNVEVTELWSGNFKSIVEDTENTKPWLITFCGDGGDCLTKTTSTKLAAMLAELVNVGSLNCRSNEKLCEKLGHDYGTVFYEDGEVKHGKGLSVTSLHAQEIAHQVLSQLPDVPVLDKKKFQHLLDRINTGQRLDWLIHFVEGDGSHDIEFRKLPGMLTGVKIGRVNCQELRNQCNELNIKKFPSFVVFKQSRGYEIYYGRVTAHDVSAFARDSVMMKLESLRKVDFESGRVGPNSDQRWFVDFFAPWCPPCMRLLPEFRKAAKNFQDTVNFGTVDCTILTDLCRMYHVQSYPTTILYNQTVPLQYHGHHSASALGEFIEDTLQPPVVILNLGNFDQVLNKDPNDLWLVDFFASWCGPCQQLAPEWRRLAKMMKDTKSVHVGQIDCNVEGALCRQQLVDSYPTLRLYPTGSQRGSGSYYTYNGWHRDAQSLRAWAFEFLPSKVQTFKFHNFHQKVLSNMMPTVVDFYAPWCGHCQVFKPEFEKIAETLDGKVSAGSVNCDQEQTLCQQAGIRFYPTVRYYKGARREGMSQNIFGQEIDSTDADHIINYIRQLLPKEQTSGHDEL